MISAAQRKSTEGVNLGASCYFSQSSPSPAVLCNNYIKLARYLQVFAQSLSLASFPQISRGLGRSPILLKQNRAAS